MGVIKTYYKVFRGFIVTLENKRMKVEKKRIGYEVEFSVNDGTYLDGTKGPLYYCVLRKDGEHMATRQTINKERVFLLALNLLSKELVDLELELEEFSERD